MPRGPWAGQGKVVRWELGQQAGGLTPPRTDSLPNLASQKNKALSTFKVQGSKSMMF